MNPRRARFATLLALLIAMECDASVFGNPHVNVRKKFTDANGTKTISAAPRIHGGYEAPEGKFRFMVILLASHMRNLKLPTLTCSASLIHEKWVLTAAHCVMPRNRPPAIIAVAGKANLFEYYETRKSLPFDYPIEEERFGVQERKVARVFVNPNYSEVKNERDLALLLLEKPFDIGENVRCAEISSKKMTRQMECTILGWGLQEQDFQSFKLMYADGVLAQTTEVSCKYLKSGPYICLEEGGPGICKGDSGSPLVCGNRIWGVSSFALSHNQNPKCGEAEEEYYSEIYPELDWIQRLISTGNGAGISRPVHVIGTAFFGILANAMLCR